MQKYNLATTTKTSTTTATAFKVITIKFCRIKWYWVKQVVAWWLSTVYPPCLISMNVDLSVDALFGHCWYCQWCSYSVFFFFPLWHFIRAIYTKHEAYHAIKSCIWRVAHGPPIYQLHETMFATITVLFAIVTINFVWLRRFIYSFLLSLYLCFFFFSVPFSIGVYLSNWII